LECGWWLCGFRARDKKKNIADEKAQSQRRLLRATKRHEAEKTERQKQKEMLERRKEELVCEKLFTRYWGCAEFLLSESGPPLD